MTITLIADDLTGACDAGAHFSGRGRVGVFVDATRVDATRAVAVVDTESRALSSSEAGARVRAVARDLRARIRAGFVFKKIDSTLRGPVTAEIEALLEVTGRPTALVCSSLPAAGRTVIGGVLRVDGLPAHTSAIGRDPAYPGDTSVVMDILRRGAARPVRHLSLESVRGGKRGPGGGAPARRGRHHRGRRGDGGRPRRARRRRHRVAGRDPRGLRGARASRRADIWATRGLPRRCPRDARGSSSPAACIP